MVPIPLLSVFIILLIALCVTPGKCDDSNTAVMDKMKKLLHTEHLLVEQFEKYLLAVETKSAHIRRFIGFVEAEMENIAENSEAHFGHPLNSFKAYKRIRKDWRAVFYTIMNLYNEEGYGRAAQHVWNRTATTKLELTDLIDAAKEVGSLQLTHKLEVMQLASGVLPKHKKSSELLAVDCYDLGMSLVHTKDYNIAVPWLLEARHRLTLETLARNGTEPRLFPYLEDEMVFQQLLAATYLNGNTKLAHWLSMEQAKQEPTDEKVKETLQSYAQILTEERIIMPTIKQLQRKEHRSEHPQRSELYERTCSGKLQPAPSTQRQLHCSYEHNDVPYCRIAPFKLEQLSRDPYVAYYHESIYDSEVEYIRTAAEAKLKARTAVKGKRRSIWLDYQQHTSLDKLAQRLQDITGLSLNGEESLQVYKYRTGEQNGHRFDLSGRITKDYGSRGQHSVHTLIHLSDVIAGGATAFPRLHLRVPAIKGNLLVWRSSQGPLAADQHPVGCPVPRGQKWVCNVRFHVAVQ